MSNRVLLVDIAKGISIILVALFHSKLNFYIQELGSSMGLFRTPLFFFLSGVFFSTKATFRTFLIQKVDALLKPYFFTLFVLFGFSFIFNFEYSNLNVRGILYGNGFTIPWVPMWFLAHLSAIYCFSYVIVKYFKINDLKLFYQLVVVFLLVSVGVVVLDFFWLKPILILGREISLPGLPFSVDIIPVSTAFFILGACLKQRTIDFKPNVYVLAFSIILFSLIAFLTDAHIDLNRREYISPLFSTIAAVCGIYFTLCLAFYMDKTKILSKTFLMFGQASLFILIFHWPISRLVDRWLRNPMAEEIELHVAAIAFLASIVVPIFIKMIFARSRVLTFFYFPVKSQAPDKSTAPA